MSELILPFAIMALTILVLIGIMVAFRKFLAERDAIFAQIEKTAAESAPPAPPAAAAPERIRRAA
jgi:hypothetical protein